MSCKGVSIVGDDAGARIMRKDAVLLSNLRCQHPRIVNNNAVIYVVHALVHALISLL